VCERRGKGERRKSNVGSDKKGTHRLMVYESVISLTMSLN
jgi:hypothetical protein